MSASDLPAGHALSRPVLDDLPEIYRLLVAHDIAVLGYPDLTEDDLRDEFTESGFYPATDAWLARDPSGEVAGYAWACRKGTAADIDIDFYVHPEADPGLGAGLLTIVERRACEIGRELGHDNVRTIIGCYRVAHDEAALLAERGFTVVTTFHRMQVALDSELADPPVPPGVTVAVCGADEALLRAAHDVKETSFRGHFGFRPETFEEWYDRNDKRSVTDWSQVWYAEVDEEPAGMLLATNAFVPTNNAGYVQTLGVHPRLRGRGLAKLLLRTAFAEMRRRGRTIAILGVDTNNTTNALGLYESVGMRPTLEIDVWRKPIELS